MNRKILVIEDTPSAAMLSQYILEQEGYEVICESNGLEGLRKAQNERHDLIILDILLPGLNGYEICSRLREKRETAKSKLPILMISAKTSNFDRTIGLLRGANAYLGKPVAPSTIMATVKKLLAESS